MEVAENSAVAQGDYVDPSFDFYNAKNLSTIPPNCTAIGHEQIVSIQTATRSIWNQFQAISQIN